MFRIFNNDTFAQMFLDCCQCRTGSLHPASFSAYRDSCPTLGHDKGNTVVVVVVVVLVVHYIITNEDLQACRVFLVV